MSKDDDQDEEWESLPHLDSTMMARGGELQIPSRPAAHVMPRTAAAPARPLAPRGRATAPVVEDYPTIPPSSLLTAEDEGFDEDGPPTSEQKVEPITDASLTSPPAIAAADEAPTPAKLAAPEKGLTASKPSLARGTSAKPAAVEEPVTQPKSNQAWQRPEAGKGLGRAVDKAALRSPDKGPEKLAEKPVEKRAEKLAERPVEKVAEKVAEKAPEKPAERFDDLGFDPQSDFAEDTDKGGGPKGFGGAAADGVDPAPFLTGSTAPPAKRLDFLGKLGKPPGSSPRVPTSGGRPGAWDNLPRKK
jgi:hypothetical protein